jgi:hypothetical protein
MRYASALFDWADIKDNYKIAYTLPDATEDSREGLVTSTENHTYLVLLIGRGDDIPPTNDLGYHRYAEELWSPTVYDAIKNAKRLTEITPYSFTESRWRHFAQVATFLVLYCRLVMPFAGSTQSTVKGVRCSTGSGSPK